MFTSRARWTLALASLALIAGLQFRQEGVALAGLAIVIWIGLEWLWFGRRVLTLDQPFEFCVRTIDSAVRASHTLTIDQDHQVEVAARLTGKMAGLRVWLEDVAPGGCEVRRTAPSIVVDASTRQDVRWQYALRPRVTGKFSLPGIHVTLTDPQGLFRQHRFVPLRHELTILPFLIRPQNTVSILKQKNAQLMTGHHRHLRAGISGELLAIRDYQTGDPPRTIAWKATARLGRLMTCEHESEVPIRATIVADLSTYQFAGRPNTSTADQIISLTAAIARLLLSDRDPVACLLVNEEHQTRIVHGGGERQLTRLLHTLLSYGTSQAVPHGLPLDDLVELTWTSCFHRFPELFDQRFNPRPGLLRIRWTRRRMQQRWQLSFALAQLYRGQPGMSQRLQEDDQALRRLCHRVLVDYPSSLTVPAAVPDLEAARRAHHTALRTMRRGLVEGVARAKDNELFILVGTTPAEDSELSTLEDSFRLARAAHHRVILISVGDEKSELHVEDPTAKRILTDIRDRAVTTSSEALQRRLARLDVRMVHVNNPRLTEEIAAEVDLLKFGRARASTTIRR